MTINIEIERVKLNILRKERQIESLTKQNSAEEIAKREETIVKYNEELDDSKITLASFMKEYPTYEEDNAEAVTPTIPPFA